MNMKTAPSWLAYFLIAITIGRVALLLDHGLALGWMGWFFAVALGAGVYVSAFYFGRPAGLRKVPGAIGLAVFGLGDLWFNEVEVIRSISAIQLLPESANFLDMAADELRWMMQMTALFFGAFPTVGAALLGWMQSVAPTITEFNQPGFLERVVKATGDVIAARAHALEMKITSIALPAPSVGQIPPRTVEGRLRVKWRNLTADDCAWIESRSRADITAKYGISDGAAGEWQRRIRNGEKPWITPAEIIDAD